MENKIYQRLLKKAGTQSKLAEAIGTSQQNISNWVKSGKPLPAELVFKTESAFGISRHILRPDIYPKEGADA